jgi:hypothetical protein
MKIATKKATTILNEDAQKGALMVSREWSKDEKKAVSNFIDAVKNKNTAQQKELEKKVF